MTITELIALYRKCQETAWGDNAPTFEYFIDWLENREPLSEEGKRV